MKHKDTNGHLYAVAFSNGMLKIGRSFKEPSNRIKTHESKAALVNAVKIWELNVLTGPNTRLAEQEALKYWSGFLDAEPSFGKEWFRGFNLEMVDKFTAYFDDLALTCRAAEHRCPTYREAVLLPAMMDSIIPKKPARKVFDHTFASLYEAYGMAHMIECAIRYQSIESAHFDASDAFGGYSYFSGVLTAYLWQLDNIERAAFMRETLVCANDCDIDPIFNGFYGIEEEAMELSPDDQIVLRDFFYDMSAPPAIVPYQVLADALRHAAGLSAEVKRLES